MKRRTRRLRGPRIASVLVTLLAGCHHGPETNETDTAIPPDEWVDTQRFDAAGDEASEEATRDEVDALVAELETPATFTAHALEGRGALRMASGLVLRRDDVLVTDWTARGASHEAYPQAIAWQIDEGAQNVVDLELDTAVVGDGPHTVDARWHDPLGREHTTARERITVDDDLHTALLMSLR